MWIKAVTSDLDAATKNVLRAVSTRTTLPVLTGIHLKGEGDKLTIRATDLEISIESSVPVSVKEKGEAVVPAKPFSEIIKNLKEGQVEIILDSSGTEISILKEQSRYKLRTFPPEEFPQGRGIPGGKVIKLLGEEFKEGVKKVSRATSKDETRITLTGVYIEGGRNSLTMAATDSYRLAVTNVPFMECVGDISLIVPAKSLEELSKMVSDEELELIITENQMVGIQKNWIFFSRLIEGQFPAFKQLFPDESFVNVVLGTEEFREALRRLSSIVQDNPVKLYISEDEIRINGQNRDLGEAEEVVEAEATGKLEVAFNYTYLMDGIQSISSEKIKIELQDGLKPAVIRPLQEEVFSYLLMPVRTPE